MNLKAKWKQLDWFIVIPYLLLCVIGIIMVFSASSNIGMQNGGSANSYLYKQTLYVILGMAILWVMYNINVKFFKNSTFLSIMLIVFAVVFLGLKFFGTAINGSPGWIPLGIFSIQPAEFVKVFFILLFARLLSHDQHRQYVFDSWRTFFKFHRKQLIWSIAILIFIFRLPDLGGMLISFTIILVMIFASGISYKRAFRDLILLLAIAFGGLFLFAYTSVINLTPFKDNYMFQRVVAFANPFVHSNGVGQQLVNSYYAISNGGFFGKGIGNSIQKTGYLPEPNTDFIMAIISEELGIIGVLVIMGLLLFIILRILIVGIRCRSTYNSLICYGTATYMLVQTYFNVGGVIGILPITGVTFPFISYGGSSMMSLCLCLGLVLKISRWQQMESKTNLAKGDN
ncbi:FtsW/RodA/SpoVE family cell cycle protein [Lactobacillaceae bacterium Melli_B4]